MEATTYLKTLPFADQEFQEIHVKTTEESPFNLYSPTSKQSPCLRLLHALYTKGIIDEFGNVKENVHTACGNDIFEKRREELLSRPIQLKVRGIDLFVTITLDEMFQYLTKILPATTLEILKKNALYLIGFENIYATFKNWGIDLIEVCGEEYVAKLAKEIDEHPFFFFLQYYIADPDPVAISFLKRGIIDFISAKLPPFLEKRNTILEMLCQKKERQYSEWLDTYEYKDDILNTLVVDELIVIEQVEPNLQSLNPIGKLSLVDENRQKFTIEISHRVPLSSQCSATDTIHLPLLGILSDEQLQKFDCHLVQGIIDKTCRIRTPILFRDAHFSDWIELLIGTVQGENSRTPFWQNAIIPQLMYFAKTNHPKKNLGVILGESITLAWNKMGEDRPSFFENPKTSLALTFAACCFLEKYVSPHDLKEMILISSMNWKELTEKDDGSIFHILAKALKSENYSSIVPYLQLSSCHLIQNGKSDSRLQAWHNQNGTEENVLSFQSLPFKEIIQLEINEGADTFFLQFPSVALSTYTTLLESAINNTNLHLLNTITGNRSDLSFENIHFSNFESCLPGLLEYYYSLLVKFSDSKKQKLFYKQFCLLLRHKNFLLTDEENKRLLRLEKTSNSIDNYFFSILEFFALSHNRDLNQAAYDLFKKGFYPALHIKAALVLCQGHIPNAIKTLLKISKETDSKTQYELLEVVFSNLEKNGSKKEIAFYLEILIPDIKKILENKYEFPSAVWLGKQLVLIGRTDLARQACLCVKDRESSVQSIFKKIDDLEGNTKRLKEKTRKRADEGRIKLKSDAIMTVKNLTPQNAYNFQKFIQFLSNEMCYIYHDAFQELWDDILLPALSKTKDAAWIQTCQLYAACLKILLDYPPNSETSSIFTEQLRAFFQEVRENTHFPRTIKNNFKESQNDFFQLLLQLKKKTEVLELGYLFNIHGMPPNQEGMLSLLTAIDKILVDPIEGEKVKKINELLNDSRLKSALSESPKTILASIYEKLSIFYMTSHIDLSFKYFQKTHSINKNPKFSLCQKFLDAFGNHNQYIHFAQLTNLLPQGKESQFQTSWEKNFNLLFLNAKIKEEEEINTHQLKALDIIVKSKNFPKLLLHSTEILERLLSVKPRSQPYCKSLSVALDIALSCSVEKYLILKLYESVKGTSDMNLTETSWDAVNLLNQLTQEEKNACALSLLQGLKDSKSKKLLEIYENLNIFPVFDLKSTTVLKAYSILFEWIEENWEKIYNPKNHSNTILKQLKTTYQKLEESRLLSAPSIESRMIRLSYAKCLCICQPPREQKKSINLLMLILAEYFKFNFAKAPILELYFASKEETETEEKETILTTSYEGNKLFCEKTWENYLKIAFKKIFKAANTCCYSFDPFYNLLIVHPDCELSILLIETLYKKPSNDDLIKIHVILFTLIKNYKKFTKNEYSFFKIFCKKFNLKKYYEELILQNQIIQLNLLTLLEEEGAKHFINEDDRLELLYKLLTKNLSTLIKRNQTDTYTLNISFKYINLFSHQNEFEDFVSLVSAMIFNESLLLDDIIWLSNRTEILNSNIGMWVTNEYQSNKLKKETVDFNSLFYKFINSYNNFMYNYEKKQSFEIDMNSFLISIIQKGFDNPSNENKSFLETIIAFSFYSNQLYESVSPDEQLHFQNFINGTANFLRKKFSDEYSNILKNIFSYYYVLPKADLIALNKNIKITYDLDSLELMQQISKLLMMKKHSGFVLDFSIKVIHDYIQNLIKNKNQLFKLLKDLSNYVLHFDLQHQWYFFHRISKLLKLINQIYPGKIEECDRAYTNYFLVVTNALKKTRETSTNFIFTLNPEMFSLYPNIFHSHSHFLIKKPSIYIKGVEEFFSIFKTYIKNVQVLNANFIPTILLAPIKILFSSINMPKNYLLKCQEIIPQWEEIIKEVGKNCALENESFLLIRTAYDYLIKNKIYDDITPYLDKYMEASAISFSISLKSENRIPISTLNVIYLSMKQHPEKKAYFIDCVNKWIQALFDISLEQEKPKSLIHNTVKYALNRGIYDASNPIPRKFLEMLK